MTVNNCGVLDQGRTYPDNNFGGYMHAHVYHKVFFQKGANNDMSFAVKNVEGEEWFTKK